MPVNFEPLRKILELEQKKGYDNSAVFGGLERFLANWAGPATQSLASPQLVKRFRELCRVGSGYTAMSYPERKVWADSMFEFASKAESTKKETTPAAKARKSPSATKTATKAPKPAKLSSPGSGYSPDSPIMVVKGISTGLSGKFAKLGVKTIRDLLYFFPHRHIDYSQKKTIRELVEGMEQTIVANVWEAKVAMLGGRRGTEAIVGDETGNIRAVWFNQPYLAKNLRTNTRVVLSGRVGLFKGRLVFESPEWEVAEEGDLVHAGRLVPIYSLTQGLYPRQVRRLMKQSIDQWAGQVADFLPEGLRNRCNLMALPEAIAQAHFPDDEVTKDRARVRLAFDELFLLQLGVMSKKRDWKQGQPGATFDIKVGLLESFVKALPFELTAAQRKVLREILNDLQGPEPMSRLLQGDVGSGKTVIATAALLVAVANGYQGALMAPTEILAEQHFATISQLLSRLAPEDEPEACVRSYSGLLPHPITLALLTGSASQGRKQGLHRRMLGGEVDIAIGTHALIQKGVDFPRLGLVVVDEQHRFGVSQRSALRQKGTSPHMLVMTATPIPRTLALTLYGDLDLSVIDELPPGRQVVKTKWLGPMQWESAYTFLRRQVAAGHQAFIICPLIEESEAVAAQAAVAEYERLSQEVFSDLRIGLLHGRMAASKKDEVMASFRSGALDILVSTAVVEVGIDIPNATVMLVESADRFGLSQLHQFRGRVGRGTAQSYCMLLTENPSVVGQQRLDIIERVQDGFVLAEEDLKLRGPGEFFGTRQSGLPDLRMARLSDTALLELARNEAVKLFEIDCSLKKPEHALLVKELTRIWPQSAEWS